MAQPIRIRHDPAKNQAGLTGAMVDQLALGTGIIILFQSTATGIAVITDSVFTNTSNIQLSVVYK